MLGGTSSRRRLAASMAAQLDRQAFARRSRQDWVRCQVIDPAAQRTGGGADLHQPGRSGPLLGGGPAGA